VLRARVSPACTSRSSAPSTSIVTRDTRERSPGVMRKRTVSGAPMAVGAWRTTDSVGEK
jgi:hypothetical protein